MAATVADVTRILDAFAPPQLAESWDHVGLVMGAPEWPANRIWAALDVTEQTVAAAAAAGIHLIISHHPLIMKPVDRIRTDTPTGRIIQKAMAHQVAIIAAHTNLDAADGGLNDYIADRLGLIECRPLIPAAEAPAVKLVFFVPQTAESAVMDALQQTVAGRIGTYTHCTFTASGTGAFEPSAESRPAMGHAAGRSEVAELRIETRARMRDAAEIIAAVRNVHPYETMAHDVYPLHAPQESLGIGRIGRLTMATPLAEVTADVMKRLDLPTARQVGNAAHPISTVALCTGSGGSLMSAFLSSGADLYISGDFGYHHARDAEAEGRALLDVGHFGSERWVGPLLVEELTRRFGQEGIDATVTVCPTETDPFVTIGDSDSPLR